MEPRLVKIYSSLTHHDARGDIEKRVQIIRETTFKKHLSPHARCCAWEKRTMGRRCQLLHKSPPPPSSEEACAIGVAIKKRAVPTTTKRVEPRRFQPGLTLTRAGTTAAGATRGGTPPLPPHPPTPTSAKQNRKKKESRHATSSQQKTNEKHASAEAEQARDIKGAKPSRAQRANQARKISSRTHERTHTPGSGRSRVGP